MTTLPAGTIHARLVMDHEDLDALLEQLVAAFGTGDWDVARATYARFESQLTTHLRVEEELLFPDFESLEPGETAALRDDHARIRAKVFELAVGVDLHQTRLPAIEELARLLRRHADRENKLLYRWADRVFPDTMPARIESFFAHRLSPDAPVQS